MQKFAILISLALLSGCGDAQRRQSSKPITESELEAKIDRARTLAYAIHVNRILDEYDRNPGEWAEFRRHLLLMELVYLLDLDHSPTAEDAAEEEPSILHMHGKNALNLLGVATWPELVAITEETERLLPKYRSIFTDKDHAQHEEMRELVVASLEFDLNTLSR